MDANSMFLLGFATAQLSLSLGCLILVAIDAVKDAVVKRRSKLYNKTKHK